MPSRKLNTFVVRGNTAIIDISTPTYPNRRAVIDLKNLPRVINGLGRWLPSKSDTKLYVARKKTNPETGRKTNEFLHRLLAADEQHPCVDHRDGDTFNNLENNLRPCTGAQNSANQVGRHAYDYKGITRRVRARTIQWEARICREGEHFRIGMFKSQCAAARAYDKVAKRLFGEFALTNFQNAAQ